MRLRSVVLLAVSSLLVVAPDGGGPVGDRLTVRALKQDTIINADIWDAEPRIMGAGLGFTGILGIPGLSTDDLAGSELLSRLAGGNWNSPACGPDEEPSLANHTSSATPEQIASLYGGEVYYADGYPIEFSWPILPSTLDPTDFELTLNTGDKVTPLVASIWPNFEYNERSVAVIFGHFGNRIPPDEPGLIWPVSIEIVEDDTPLMLVGPGGVLSSAVGLTFRSPPPSSYTDPDVVPEERGGPVLAAAKLSRMSNEGDDGPRIFGQDLPNDGISLYGDAAEYRLRVYTTGGMTPDGVRGVFPTDYSRFFRVRAESSDGTEILITETDTDYTIDGRTLRVLGLADLGVEQSSYTDCYAEDKDNYIDIVIAGDEEAVRRITHVEIPSAGTYDPLFNPGGPGNAPTPGVRYAAGSPPISQAVMLAIDDPMTVTYPAP